MPVAIVNGITRIVPELKPCRDTQFSFWWREGRYGQIPFFMVWELFYDETGEVVHGNVLFNSINWIGF